MRIGSLNPKRPNTHREGNSYYQSKKHKRNVEAIWKRDKGLCQICLKNGRMHHLIRGTQDIYKQGTVDHIRPRNSFNLTDPIELVAADSLDNQWLIGTIHHAKKSGEDKRWLLMVPIYLLDQANEHA